MHKVITLQHLKSKESEGRATPYHFLISTNLMPPVFFTVKKFYAALKLNKKMFCTR
jgi:hypothetical protein